jgi:N-glycosidase YbiA
MDKIGFFDGEYIWLSNFHKCQIEYGGEVYPTVEHAYQAAKTTDENERAKIRKLNTPGQAKTAGRKVTMRDGWDKYKLDVMYELTRQKYTAHEDLKQKLIETGGAVLEEGNTWGDKFWGKVGGIGSNHLGRILMRVRGEIVTSQGVKVCPACSHAAYVNQDSSRKCGKHAQEGGA